MGLLFYPKILPLPEDHCIHQHLEDIPERFERQRITKDWMIEGPFIDECKSEYYFMLSCRTDGIHEQHTLSESDFLFSEKAVNGLISKMIARAMEVELSLGVAQRLMGASEEEVNSPGDETITVVEDFSRGTGKVYQHCPSRDDADSSAEKSGGLILPA